MCQFSNITFPVHYSTLPSLFIIQHSSLFIIQHLSLTIIQHSLHCPLFNTPFPVHYSTLPSLMCQFSNITFPNTSGPLGMGCSPQHLRGTFSNCSLSFTLAWISFSTVSTCREQQTSKYKAVITKSVTVSMFLNWCCVSIYAASYEIYLR